jgi:8-oxo-dGTP pyrophosphatase MutT (NUDIX family)
VDHHFSGHDRVALRILCHRPSGAPRYSAEHHKECRIVSTFREHALRREVACAILLDMSGRFLLQQRDSIPGILHPGKISLFGGHREGSETYLQCVVREIYEEIGYFVPPGRFQYLSSYDDNDLGQPLHGELFFASDLPAQDLVITEGSLLIVEPGELIALDSQFTPDARFAIHLFLKTARTPPPGVR